MSLPEFSFTSQGTDKKHDNLPPPENEKMNGFFPMKGTIFTRENGSSEPTINFQLICLVFMGVMFFLKNDPPQKKMPMCFFLTQKRYGYELGRFMLPLHAEPSLDEGTPGSGRYGTHLVEGLDVFGARAAERWPRLKELRNSGVEGAEEMYHLQELMPQRLPGGWSGY